MCKYFNNRSIDLSGYDFYLNLFGFLFGLAEHFEHVLFVRLNAGLVKGVNARHVAGDGAGKLKKAH